MSQTKEEKREYDRKRYDTILKDQRKEDYLENREQKIKYQRMYRLKNLEHIKEYNEEYYLKKGFKIIKDNSSAEEVIVKENFGIVVSYVSSTLFNLKSMYQEATRCIALSNRLLSEKRIDYNDNRFDEVYELFRKINIEVIEI